MLENTKKDVLKRLNFVEGHLAGIRRMVDEDKYCVDVLKQTFAVRCAIQKIDAVILNGHLRTHVIQGLQSDKNDEVLNELMELFNMQER
ncbi:MAG: hypothetical protein BZY82_03865 [SAR202 cluster bacterium Io17-Chloro-G3]|nr:MAG: hypothetical protein BZY82_03865 [SAR202 cluster bacterium Io17-Chloro-G3]